MDKGLLLIALLFIGAPIVGLTLILSWVMDNDRFYKGQCDNDSDIRIYIPHRRGDRRGNNGHDQQEGKQ